MVTVKTRSTSRKIRLQTSGPETVPRWDLGRSFHWDEILIVTSRVGNRTETVHYGDCGKDFSQKTRRILHKENLCIPEGLIIGPFTIIFWLYTKIRNDIPLKIVTDMKWRKQRSRWKWSYQLIADVSDLLALFVFWTRYTVDHTCEAFYLGTLVKNELSGNVSRD